MTLLEILTEIAAVVYEAVKATRWDKDAYCGDDLAGMCAIASYLLWQVLERVEIEASFVYGEAYGCEHCWVEVGEYLVDVTVEQFAGVHTTKPPKVKIALAALCTDYEANLRGEEALRSTNEWGGQAPTAQGEAMRRAFSRVLDRLAV